MDGFRMLITLAIILADLLGVCHSRCGKHDDLYPASRKEYTRCTSCPRSVDNKRSISLFSGKTFTFSTPVEFRVSATKTSEILILNGLKVKSNDAVQLAVRIEATRTGSVTVPFSRRGVASPDLSRGLVGFRSMIIRVSGKGRTVTIKGIDIQLCKVNNHCEPHPCNHGQCARTDNGFKCRCEPGWFGTVCDKRSSNPCKPNPCQNGECQANGNSFKCRCFTGWTGTKCSNKIKVLSAVSSPCKPDPCENGKCTASGSKYKCVCYAGWTGTKCGMKVSTPCKPNPCQKGKCIASGNSYKCKCYSGWTGPKCGMKVKTPCSSNPCKHGKCTISGNSYKCQCYSGWTGPRCYRKKKVSTPCSPNPCQNGECKTSGSSYKCQCYSGWTGSKCDKKVNDPCKPDPCRNGKCKTSGSGYKCDCNSGWTGTKCDKKVDISNRKCSDLSSPCGKNGFCQNSGNGHECHCFRGWMGDDCNINIDDCPHYGCVNGRCIDGVGSYSCVCDLGWTGKDCDKVHLDDPRCPNGYQRKDINYGNRNMFDVTITPNINKQTPTMGLINSEFKDGGDGYLKLAGDDKMIVKLKSSYGDIYLGQICLKTFVVDIVTINIYYSGQSSPKTYKLDPPMGSEWFRSVCTPAFNRNDKFKKLDKIEIKYAHQPPNFNVKDFKAEACLLKKYG